MYFVITLREIYSRTQLDLLSAKMVPNIFQYNIQQVLQVL
jgi:hypothetical protein